MKEYYLQRNEIATLFQYRLWQESDRVILLEKSAQLAKTRCYTHIHPDQLIVFLNDRKIVRPGYTTVQAIIGDAPTSGISGKRSTANYAKTNSNTSSMTRIASI
jgi:hypothetical protein